MRAGIPEYSRHYELEAREMWGLTAEIDVNDYVKYRIEGFNPDESYRHEKRRQEYGGKCENSVITIIVLIACIIGFPIV